MPKGPGRPNQGKTKTIKERTVNVYLPSKDMVNEWKETAKGSGLSLSQYILEAVERERAHGSEPRLPRLELEKELKETQERLSALQSKYEILEAAFIRAGLKTISILLRYQRPWVFDIKTIKRCLKSEMRVSS
jgi:hypothetical protein